GGAWCRVSTSSLTITSPMASTRMTSRSSAPSRIWHRRLRAMKARRKGATDAPARYRSDSLLLACAADGRAILRLVRHPGGRSRQRRGWQHLDERRRDREYPIDAGDGAAGGHRVGRWDAGERHAAGRRQWKLGSD